MGMFLRFRQKLTKVALVSALGFTTIAMNGCDAIYWDEQETLSRVQAKGEVVVLTTQSPLIYSKPKKGVAFGIDHDLLENFAHRYNLKIRYVVLPDEDSVIRALMKGEGDIAAARLRTPRNNTGFLKSPAYEETFLSLYCHKKSQVQNIQDLNGKRIQLLNKDNYFGLSQRLLQLSPSVQLEILENTKTQDLFTGLPQRKTDCVIAENFSGDFYTRYHTSVEKVTALTESYSLSWLLTPDNYDLVQLMNAWYQQASRDDEIMRTLDRYKTYLAQLDKRDIAQFFKKIRSTLPLYRQAFKDAGEEHGLPWQLIASVAYQESHWNPDARSFTGVRGLMQLTTETADHVGIEDRTDPMQSIWGGSKYLRYLWNRTPNDLNPKDRLALTLAAYNVGVAHLKDAQKLAEKMGRNPNSWRHLREVLPLLANPDYAAELEYGPARGYETVDFVERVKSFYNLMNSGV
ncbi:membrane-bound lytic murein transglycosylase MltF [Bdellovibrio bacteriovorus]|nr:membrane-bound lytic murein transglycosylase MltF [Bdellovibrio bacteriovorus]